VVETQNKYKALYDFGQVTSLGSKMQQCRPFCLCSLEAGWDRLACYVHVMHSEVLELFVFCWSCSTINNSGS